MVEYLGYQGRADAIDWAGIADKAITGYNTIQKDREEQRASLEKSADDLVSASKQYKPGQSNVFNEKILQGADRVRANTLDLKKELMAGRITPTEYKARVGKMSGDWKLVGDFAKSYNDIITKNTEYLNDPKSSALGAYMLEKQAGLSDLSGKNFVVDESGSIVLSDPNSGMVVDFMSMLNPENQTPEKVDLLGQVAGFTKNLGAVTGYDKGFWTKSAQLNPAYTKAKENFAASLLKNPRSAASILSDYVGDYEYYETEQQKKNIPAGKGIQLVMGPNGIATPKLTPEQLKAAQTVVERQVDAEVEKLREQPEPIKAASGSGGDGGSGGAKTPNLIMDYASFAAQDPVFANAILKSRALPGEPNSFVEKVELGSDGKYRFYTYGYSEPTEKQKAKGERPRPSKAVVTRTVNASQIRSVFADILSKSQSVDKNEAWNQGILPQDYNQSYVRQGQSYRPNTSTTQKKKPLPQ